MASLSGTQTEKNLMAAFAGECQAMQRYAYWAKKAHKEGFIKVARVFEETAQDERAHASTFYKLLPGPDCRVEATYGVPGNKSTEENLQFAAAGEHEEATELYPEFAKVAREEGFESVAKVFEAIVGIETRHEGRYNRLAERMRDGTMFKRPEKVLWRCLNCGHLHEGPEPPKVCPACAHPQGYYEVFAESL